MTGPYLLLIIISFFKGILTCVDIFTEWMLGVPG